MTVRVPEEVGMVRHSKHGIAMGVGIVTAVLISGCASAPSVPETGHTTTVQVRMVDGFYVPDTVEVPAGDRLVLELTNKDRDLHDLVFENDAKTTRFGQGQSETLDVGVISADLEGWCSIPPHREMGMVFHVAVIP